MNYSLINLPKSEVEIEVILPFSEFEPHLKTAARLIAEEIEIEGFRKGKAPYDIVKNKVGESALLERAVEVAVRSSYPQAREQLIQDGKLSSEHPAIGRPEVTVTKLAPSNEFVYKIKIAILPSVELPDYRAVAKSALAERQESIVTDEEVGKAIAWLQESRMTLVAAARPAAMGDHVEVDFEIRHDGVKIAEGDSRSHPLVIGQGKFMPGFEDQLIGMQMGEKKTFALIAPENWREATVAGKTLDFSVTMQAVQERILPGLTDEFAKGLGAFASLEALRSNVRDGILTEKKEKEHQRIRGLIIAEITQKSKMELPEVLVTAEIEKMLHELQSGVGELGMQWPDYLVHVKKTEADLRREWQDEARNRVRAALVLREIARKENINPTEDEIRERANQFLAQYKNIEETKRNIDPVRSNPDFSQDADAPTHRTSNEIDPAELHDYTQGILKNEKVFELLETL